MASLDSLYTRKRQYENLRPTLVTCKDQLERASNSLSTVLNSLLSCLTIDGEGYKYNEFQTQKNNIDRNINTVNNAISKLDNSYNSVCNQIATEEARIKNANNSSSSNTSKSTTGSGSSSSTTSGSGKSNNNRNKTKGYTK